MVHTYLFLCTIVLKQMFGKISAMSTNTYTLKGKGD